MGDLEGIMTTNPYVNIKSRFKYGDWIRYTWTGYQDRNYGVHVQEGEFVGLSIYQSNHYIPGKCMVYLILNPCPGVEADEKFKALESCCEKVER